MQLSDILEEHSLKNISKKTNISEENIENILEKRFENIDRVKTMGFLSIIEREFNADLSTLRKEAQAFYIEYGDGDKGVVVGVPFSVEKKGKSKSLFIIVFVLLAVASWYFLTQYDKTHMNALQPDESVTEVSATQEVSQEEIDIMQTIKQKWQSIVNDDQKDAVVAEQPLITQEKAVDEMTVEVVDPLELAKQKPEETNVARVAEDE